MWRQNFKTNYKVHFWIVLAVPLLLVSWGILLNQDGHRLWNVLIGLVLGLVPAYYFLKPTILEFVGGAGIADNVTDGKSESIAKELSGGLRFIGDYVGGVVYLFVAIQTIFMMLAIRRFEDTQAAYIAVFAAMIFGLAVWAFIRKGKWFPIFILWFWGILMVVSIGLAYFVPNYFKDDTAFLMRHTQGVQEATRRIARRDELLLKEGNGQQLTLQDRRDLQYLNNQEAAVSAVIATSVTTAVKLEDGLGEREITLAITPASYTCKAELTAKDHKDLAVAINGIGVDLATTAYINGQPCNSEAKVDFGPDGKAILHWNLDDDVKVTVRGVSRWVRITFTPA